jgi:hypothetical protein
MSLSQLKNFDADRFDIDELVALSAEGKALQAEYKALDVEVPEWLDSTVTSIGRVINLRLDESLQKRLRQAEARIQALKPASERRAELESEVAKLRTKLGK